MGMEFLERGGFAVKPNKFNVMLVLGVESLIKILHYFDNFIFCFNARVIFSKFKIKHCIASKIYFLKNIRKK
jgi:hypothetical protein